MGLIGTCYNLGHKKKGVADISAIISQEKKICDNMRENTP